MQRQLLTTRAIAIDNAIDSSSNHAVSNSAVATALAGVNTALAGKADVTTVQTESGTDVSLTLDHNTMYQCSTLYSLTITGVATGFEYASLTFTSPATPTTFSMPDSDWYCVGANCSSGTFTPESNMRYNLAIQQESDRIAIYIVGAL